jgi:hypothetical protein
MRKLALAILAWLLGAHTVAAQPQGMPIVGVWSAPLRGAQVSGGQAMMFLSFAPDGSCQQTFLIPAGQTTYTCRYQPFEGGITITYLGWEPRQLPPVLPINQPMRVAIQFQSANLFYMEDASGPLRFIRQR